PGIEMRLKKGDQSIGPERFADGPERRADFGGVMGVIVINPDTAALPHPLQPPPRPPERRDRIDRLFPRRAEAAGRRQRAHRVQNVMPTDEGKMNFESGAWIP